MRLRPISTLPERLRLRMERRRNAREIASFWSRDTRHAPVDLPSGEEVGAWLRASTLEAFPHPYALLGHQISNYISAALWADDLGLRFVGGTLNKDAGGLLALPVGGGQSGRLRRLPCVPDETAPGSREALLATAVEAVSAAMGPVRFRLAVDQGRWDQTPASELVRSAFAGGRLGSLFDELEKGPEWISLHIRRPAYEGEIAAHEVAKRWVELDYYVKIVRQLREHPVLGEIPVRAFGLGNEGSYDDLLREGVQLRLNGDRDRDLLELASSTVIVTSPSSFSFTAALASRGVVLARHPWWHRIPNEGRWVPVEADGSFRGDELGRALRFRRGHGDESG